MNYKKGDYVFLWAGSVQKAFWEFFESPRISRIM